MNRLPDELHIHWHGHACFSLDNDFATIVMDPYRPDRIGYPDLCVPAHAMLVSHHHEDHDYPPAVQLLPPPAENWLQDLTHGGRWPENRSIWSYRRVMTAHDDQGGQKRGANTVHILHSAGLTVVHLGDLGHPLTPAQIEAIGSPDLLLIPVGGFYTLDASGAIHVINQLKPRNIAPMHYQIGYGDLPISTVDLFLRQAAENWKIEDLRGSQLNLTATVSGRCFVFQYQ